MNIANLVESNDCNQSPNADMKREGKKNKGIKKLGKRKIKEARREKWG